ncbi:hypothetical protein B6N60_04863 [Richelia sinica FACHB-800]|uniref:Uncharacterized protein n=1 Tax=Richelia sinica FACHB-800 TaxID=1357546 RepID=A0A975TDI7_9NOST|nr:hypothetical protein [Richelia sinica]MBD2666237.1 hypothetical protein [Richelia sinica FACHB-800]QXE26132.1 hypothetical protein B6N60_04863 [Richelia sinica FACHB-800]
MKLIKKSEKLIQKPKIVEEGKEQEVQIDSRNLEDSVVDNQLNPSIEYQEPNFVPMRDNAVVLSVGNTGWQISEIWKDIRLDSF